MAVAALRWQSATGRANGYPSVTSAGWKCLLGRLAQLGEHQLDKLGVTGSSPVPPTSETPASPGVFVFWSDYEEWRSAWLVPGFPRGPGRLGWSRRLGTVSSIRSMIAVRRLILPASVGLAALALAGCGAGSDPSTGQHATSKQDVARTYLAAIRRGDLKAALALASAGSKDFASGFDKTLRQEVVGDHLARVTGPVVRDDAFVYELTGTSRQKNDAGAVVLIAHDQVTLQLSFERAGARLSPSSFCRRLRRRPSTSRLERLGARGSGAVRARSCGGHRAPAHDQSCDEVHAAAHPPDPRRVPSRRQDRAGLPRRARLLLPR